MHCGDIRLSVLRSLVKNVSDPVIHSNSYESRDLRAARDSRNEARFPVLRKIRDIREICVPFFLSSNYRINGAHSEMEEASSSGASPSRDDSLEREIAGASLDERWTETRISLGSFKTPPTKKAKRVRFFRNGDKFYTGVVMAVTPERYRNFDSLASDLTRALVSSVTLPNGVRSIYTMDGRKVQGVGDLEDGKSYVVSGQGEIFKRVEYSASKVRRGSSLSGLPQLPAGTGRQTSTVPNCVRARIVTLVRNGSRPRKIIRLLLNKRNSASVEHVFEAITEAVKLDSGAVRRVYAVTGKPVIALEQFFENDEIFVAYGSEKSTPEDFDLDAEESRAVQSFRRGPWISKRQSGPMPVMPRKSGKRILAAPQVRTPSPSTLVLPQPLRFQYSVGHIIGDGNFAVVRHCIHKATGAEYAMKIVDKCKCQGKETMLASEVAILRQVCHPNIISLIGEQETVDQLFLVMELVKGGDLFDAIAAATKFSEAEASVMISHLTSALAYLHSHQIVHRDVKPENLLVELEGSRVRCLKLGDFGLAQVVREPLYTVCGTPTYVAPEILAESGYGLKIDVWAAGVILYILLCGFPPFVSLENDQEELFERILSGQYEFTTPYWDPVSDTAKLLILNMLQPQPELRFSAEDVLDHPWLVSFPGGEQAIAGGGSIAKSSKQHRDQQCQPLRVATFEFDYKKSRQVDDLDGHVDGNNGVEKVAVVAAGNVDTKKWLDASITVNEAYRRYSNATNGPEVVDRANGNNGNEEPLSLSADCLRDIRDLTTSLNDLVIGITDDGAESSSSSFNEHKDSSRPFEHSNTPKTGKHRRKNLCKIRIFDRNDTRDEEKPTWRMKNTLDTTSRSTGSSDNNIETSDSFVNVKLAENARRANDSTASSKSLQSSDSFDNTRFADLRDSKEPRKNLDEKTRRTGPAISTKNTRPSLIPVQTNGLRKYIDNSKIPINETVKLRDKKNLVARSKRFSSVTTQYNPNNDVTVASAASCENGRKCNSSDELRDEQPCKTNVARTKRFSLYYTPQPARKNYEMENRNSRLASKTPDGRPLSWKTPETSNNKACDDSRINGTRESTRTNRKSVVESTTVSSRNKTTRQNLHTRNSNLPPGRTK